MKVKLIAIGNVLMGDDGIAISIARELEHELTEMGIQVIYGETDIGYCMTRVEEEDDVIILDASYLGKRPGEITKLCFDDYEDYKAKSTQHLFSFSDCIKIYFPKVKGCIYAVEVSEISNGCCISPILSDHFEDIAMDILERIRKEYALDR